MGISTESKDNLPWKKAKYLMEQKVIQMIVRMILIDLLLRKWKVGMLWLLMRKKLIIQKGTEY